MKCLAIDTSGDHLTVALIDGESVVYEFCQDTGLRHSISLMPYIESVLNKAKVNIKDVDVYSCVIGPGSFTGIRIGVSTVKAFSYANDKPVLPVTSFDVLEYNKPYGKNLTVIDARHDNYYACAYEDNKVVIEPSFMTKDEIINLKGEYSVLSAVDSDITSVKCDLLNGLINAVKDKLNSSLTDRESLIPLYVKKSQAEEGL